MYSATDRRPPFSFRLWVGLLLVSPLLLSGCGRRPSDRPDIGPLGIATAGELQYPEGNPSVPPEEGGPGFSGEGWETYQPGPLGDTAAVRGGMITTGYRSWPENLRVYGTGSNTFFNSIIQSLCYETLLSMHPITLEPIPALASHWQILDDNMRFRFRIDPRAHWSDGKPVTADDVLATYRLVMDDTLIDPMMKQALSELEEPTKVSKYIVEVKARERNWRNFLTFMSFPILPAHQIGELSGEEYLNRYSGRLTAGSGPYVLIPSDIRQNRSLTLTRRTDYWGDQLEQNRGLNNFTRIEFTIVLDQRLDFDRTLRGDLDFHAVYVAQWWVEDLPRSRAIADGHLVAQKVYTRNPSSTQGMAFNMRRRPLDDVRVRKALALLFDRETMLRTFAFDEYDPLQSYFPGGDAENPDNVKVTYDPSRALQLLSEAGYTERGPDGILRNREGRRLSLTIMYSTDGFAKYFTTYREACRAVGVEIQLEHVDPESEWNRKMSRDFQVANSAWSGTLFPDPRSVWRSAMADREGSNNIIGFKNEEVDRLIDAYNQEFDLQERNRILREMDGIIYNEHPYALQWYSPSERLLYWNKFGTPQGVLTRYGDWRVVFTHWWIDPEKEAALNEARRSGIRLPREPEEVRFWAEYETEPPPVDPPAEEVPAEELPAEETPAEETATDEVPVEEVPAEEVPAEAPVETEQPAEEPAGEETSEAEEPPAEEASEEVAVEEEADEPPADERAPVPPPAD